MTIGPSEKMSKSKKNVIAPEAIIDDYGADTIRWFMLSDTPPERDIEWTDAGAEGCWRFVQRIWRLVTEAEGLPAPGTPVTRRRRGLQGAAPGHAQGHRRGDRRSGSICASTAPWRSFTPWPMPSASADKADGAVRREALEALVLLSAPMMPHLAETCWQALGHDKLVAETPWPKHDPALLASDSVTIAVQVNGKRRGEIAVAARCRQQDGRSRGLALDGVIRALDGKAPKKVIVVPDRIVNIVA